MVAQAEHAHVARSLSFSPPVTSSDPSEVGLHSAEDSNSSTAATVAVLGLDSDGPIVTEHNVLKRPVKLPAHCFSPAMMRSLTAFAQAVISTYPLPGPGDPQSARLHPYLVQVLQADYFPPTDDERMRHYGLLYGRQRREGNELFYGLDIATTTIPADVRALGIGERR